MSLVWVGGRAFGGPAFFVSGLRRRNALEPAAPKGLGSGKLGRGLQHHRIVSTDAGGLMPAKLRRALAGEPTEDQAESTQVCKAAGVGDFCEGGIVLFKEELFGAVHSQTID